MRDNRPVYVKQQMEILKNERKKRDHRKSTSQKRKTIDIKMLPAADGTMIDDFEYNSSRLKEPLSPGKVKVMASVGITPEMISKINLVADDYQ
jgi:hypothetical protein